MKIIQSFTAYLLVASLSCAATAHTKPAGTKKQALTYALYEKCIALAPREAAQKQLAELIRTHYIDVKSLNGTPAKLAIETCLATIQKLPRYDNANDMKRRGIRLYGHYPLLYTLDTRIPLWRRKALPYVWTYSDSLARAVATALPTKATPYFRITSLVRPIDFQEALARQGASPAACGTHTVCSTHTSGATFDISLRDLDTQIRTFLIRRLTADMKAGKILFILERHTSHFHVFVLDPKQPLPL